MRPSFGCFLSCFLGKFVFTLDLLFTHWGLFVCLLVLLGFVFVDDFILYFM